MGVCVCLFLCMVLFTSFFAARRVFHHFDSIAVLSLTDGVQKVVLNNGLTLITKEVHSTPVVTVQVWYRVGSRYEPDGQNGISHQLEHLMFKGTSDRPIQFGRLFSALGSDSNAYTSYDETVYYNTIQRDGLEALLLLEADRMVNACLTQDHLDSEKRVVISELQGYENDPDYRLDRAVKRVVFPHHSYGLPVGGTRADVEGFTLKRVQEYYQSYYSPDNAVLVVVGDFATESLVEQVQHIFGRIPRRPPAFPRRMPMPTLPVLDGPRSAVVLEEPGSAPLLQAVYPLPSVNHPDIPALDVLDMILTGGRSSRLYQAMVETGLASDVSAYPVTLAEAGWYEIWATATSGRNLSRLEPVLQKTLADLQQHPVSAAELDQAKVQLRASFIFGNQDITSQAMQFGYDEVIAGDYQYSDRYLAAIAQVTVADVQRVAKTYLSLHQRTLGRFHPTEPMDGARAPSGAGVTRTTEQFTLDAPVNSTEVAPYLPHLASAPEHPPLPLPQEFRLANGLRVLLLEDPSVPTVNLSGWVDAGSQFDSQSTAGLASLTAESLLSGTTTQSALDLARALEQQGAGLDFEASQEGMWITGSTLADRLPILVNTLADVLQRATFPTQQLNLTRQQLLTDLKIDLNDPESLSWRQFQQMVYPPGHPLHTLADEASLNRMTRDQVVQFYHRHYRPEATTLVLVGDFAAEAVRSLLKQAFDAWKNIHPAAAPMTIPGVSLPATTMRHMQVLPGKAESVITLGYNSISRRDDRYYAALVMNQILGGDTLSSRLGMEIRDRQGLTYGIYSGFVAGIHPGPFSITLQTNPNQVERAIASTVTLLRQLREQGVTAAELEIAKRTLSRSYPVDLSSPHHLASTILVNAVFGLPREELYNFPAAIEAVTLAQVQLAIRDLIHPDRLVISIAGPSSTELPPDHGQ